MAEQKQKYLIQVEGNAPIVAQFEVWAENEDAAAELFERQPHMARLRERPFIDLPRMQKRKLSVKDLLTGMIRLIRNF
jgi:hypothetical protein